MTVLHNGVLVQDGVELARDGAQGQGEIRAHEDRLPLVAGSRASGAVSKRVGAELGGGEAGPDLALSCAMRRGRPTEATRVSQRDSHPSAPFRLVPQPGKLGSCQECQADGSRTTSFGGYGQTERKAFPVRARPAAHPCSPQMSGLPTHFKPGTWLRLRRCHTSRIADYPPAINRSKRGLPRSGANVGSILSQPGERLNGI